MRAISIINKSTVVPQVEFFQTCVAVSKQYARDFLPVWGISVSMTASQNDQTTERIYVVDDADQAGALGYHLEDDKAVPIGYVFAKTSKHYGEAWSATLSHELLEQIVDPFCNVSALGRWNRKPAQIAMEVCDPVENGEYSIDGVQVSNFVTPHYYVQNAPSGSRIDYLGKLHAPFTLDEGGYLSYCSCLNAWHQAFGQKAPQHQLVEHWMSRRGRRKGHLSKLIAALGKP